ncbi:MAG: hypothetical protein HY302_13820, partial [Opitutae bacterium]|nr:hypothetical protein [Opitutae bacterium]
AREWNAKDRENGNVGYVTKFEVVVEYLEQFPVKCVGASGHQELWIPAESLAELNRKIVGPIKVIHEFRGT